MMSFEKFDKLCDFLMETFDLTNDEATETASVVFDKICKGFEYEAEPLDIDTIISALFKK